MAEAACAGRRPSHLLSHGGGRMPQALGIPAVQERNTAPPCYGVPAGGPAAGSAGAPAGPSGPRAYARRRAADDRARGRTQQAMRPASRHQRGQEAPRGPARAPSGPLGKCSGSACRLSFQLRRAAGRCRHDRRSRKRRAQGGPARPARPPHARARGPCMAPAGVDARQCACACGEGVAA